MTDDRPLPRPKEARAAESWHATDEAEKNTEILGDAPTMEAPSFDREKRFHFAPESRPVDVAVIEGYEIREELGRGGMGVVFRARHVKLDRDVALKMLLTGPVIMDEMLARFQAEARAVAQLQHPNIAQVYEVGESAGKPWLALEFVEGGTLAQQTRGKPQSAAEASKLVAVLAAAIHFSHEKEILHRDLKPANVLLTRDGTPKISDFGLAKSLGEDVGQTRTGQIMGTPSYMAPEQARGDIKNIGPACDVYALGAILYELLTGRAPFHAPDTLQTLQMVVSDEPVRPRRLQPKIPRDLETICLKCLEKNPRRRYASARELADDLDRFVEGRPIAARPVRVWERAAKWSRRRPAAAALILVSLAATMALIAGGAWYNARLRNELDRSDRLFTEGRDFARWILYDHTDRVVGMMGSTTLSEELGARSLKYLDHLAKDTADDVALAADVAAAYERIAEVQGTPDRFSNLTRDRSDGQPSESAKDGELQALATFDKALALRQRVRDDNPSSLTARIKLAITRNRRAGVLAVLGQIEEAKKELLAGEQTLQPLLEQSPGNSEITAALASVQGQIGEVFFLQNNLEEALARFEQSLATYQEVADADAKNPKKQQGLALAHDRLGRLLEALGERNEEALSHYEQAHGQTEVIAAARPFDVRTQEQLANLLLKQADLQTQIGDEQDVQQMYTRAMAAYQQALKVRRALAVLGPADPQVQRDLVIILERVGTAYQALRQDDKALELFQEALAAAQHLVALKTGNSDDNRNLWIVHDKLGSCQMLLGKFDEAQKNFHAALDIAQQMVETDAGTLTDQQGVAQAYYNIGALEFQRLSPNDDAQFETAIPAALDWLRKSQKAYGQIAAVEPLTPEQQRLADVVQRTIGLLEDAAKQLGIKLE